jgi:hypothetical protein
MEQTLTIDVPGALILNQEGLMIDAALSELGVAYVFESSVARARFIQPRTADAPSCQLRARQ